jgi:V8-like Glu-specific endopeptidase
MTIKRARCLTTKKAAYDLKALVGEDGKPLWNGTSAIQAQEATAAQHAEWEQSRDRAI